MKKAFILFFLALIVGMSGFSQSNLTQDQIRNYATQLGVPYEALQRLVDSYRAQTGLSNPNAGGAQLLSIRELVFMQESDMLETGSYYRIQPTRFFQEGRSVLFSDGSDTVYGVETSFLINIPRDTKADTLIGVRADGYGKPRVLFLVEIVPAR